MIAGIPSRRMRRAGAGLWTLALLVALLGGIALGAWLAPRLAEWGFFGAAGTAADSGDGVDDEQLYTCGMHPNVIQRGPGECPICHMKLTPMKAGDDEEDDGPQERRVLYWRSTLLADYVSDGPGEDPLGVALSPVYADESESVRGPTIRIEPATVQNMGIRTAAVRSGPLKKSIRTVGRVDYDERSLAVISTKFEGWIEALHVDQTGVAVAAGDPLFDIYSPKLYAAQQELLAALQGIERLARSGIPQAHDEVQRMVEAARLQLRYLDMPGEQIADVEATRRIRRTVTIHSPVRGIVTEKSALAGSFIAPGAPLYSIADLSTVWVYADIYEYQLPWVRVGQETELTLPYLPGRTYAGRVSYVYPYLEPRSRVVRVRLEIENPQLDLKPGMFATVTLRTDLGRTALLVPREAYIDSGARQVVFVVRESGRYQPREIQVGVEAEDGMVEVRYGLDEGERVVTSGQFLLDSESRLMEARAKMLGAAMDSDDAPPPPTEPAGHGAHPH